ncbi:MAG: Txe/YoeB family addiction module toxin [Xenococcaceae cyanobacterium MO_207.B15]|nr:Txe/YoeB family addiction module toxin [Xenococcaceae cyanobacterium MO_207.B15]
MSAKNRKIIFNDKFRQDLGWWYKKDRTKAEKILNLVEAVTEDPFKGIGKPEPLKYLSPNTWSRRITKEHRLVYRVAENFIEFLQAKYHY